VAKAVRELKAGKIEFKVDKTGNINNAVGKVSFSADQIVGNAVVLLQAIAKAKPSTSKGIFLRSLYLSTTMGPGLKIDLQALTL
jgi:large subunit ribosomal protein L1